MIKLFACYLGGKVAGCHIEMHDIQFSIGATIEDCYDDLKSKRVGLDEQMHIDAFLELKYVDGYEIILSKEKIEQTKKLYFINAGGYSPDFFGEIHEVGFYVADSSSLATQKALQVLCSGKDKQHKDDIYDVDDCIAIEKVKDYYIELRKTDLTQNFLPMYYGYGTLNKSLSEKIIHHNY